MNVNLDLYEAKNKLFELKAMVKGYPEIKTKVKAATNADPWGPTQQQMQEICDACHGYEDRRLVMRALWKRITTTNTKEWPHVYKSLAVFEFLLLHGPESIADEIREQLYNLKTLHEFQAMDEKGQDKGFAIREKSKKLVSWLTDNAILTEERAKSAALQSKFVGISCVGGASVPTTTSSFSSNTVSRNTQPSSFSSSASTLPRATPKPMATTTDVEALQADEDYVQQQASILQSIEDARNQSPPSNASNAMAMPDLFSGTSFDTSNHSTPAGAPSSKPKAAAAATAKPAVAKAAAPKPTPAAPKPAPAPVQPKSEDLFDPFGDLTPKPKPASDLNDFFDSAPAQSAFDPFASPPPPAKPTPAPAPAPVEADLFSTPASAFDAPADLFASGDPFSNTDAFSTGAPEASAAGKKTMFQDSQFDQLCSLDKLAITPQQAAAAEVERRGPAQSLKAMKAQQQQRGPAMTPAMPSQDSYNPFL